MSPLKQTHLRLAELMAAFSLAMDLGLGRPMEWVMRTCLLGVHLSNLLGLSQEEQRQVYYLSLLRHIGCTATADWEAAVFGNELALGDALITDAKHPAEALRFLLNAPGRGQPLLSRVRYIGRALAAGPAMKGEVDRIQCEVAGQLAQRLGFSNDIRQALGQVFERWDGQGEPNQLKGENLALSVRVVHLAQDAVTVQMMSGLETAVAFIRQRANRLYDPVLVEAFCQAAPNLFAQLEVESTWEAIIRGEPGTAVWLSEADFDQALTAIADFTDLKSPYLSGHSRGVAHLAQTAAQEANLPDSDALALWRAGLIHDLGRVGISAGIWSKPGPLTDAEWERVRLHPYLTERVLARSAVFTPIVALAVLHHERLDGSGYFRRLPETMLSLLARILAAADAYQAMTEPRPHRPALTAEAAATELRREIRAGRLDAHAVDAVLSAAGHEVSVGKETAVANLSPREIEVLRLLVHGFTNRQMAERLVISPKTVGHHIQHIYNKIGVSSRAAAALFAMQHNLLSNQ